VDLEEDDPNPRFGVCDACDWDSLVWIEWDEAARATMDMDKEKYLAREIAAMRGELPTESRITGAMYSLEGFTPSHPAAACCLMLELWPIASAAFMHDVCDAIGLFLDDHRSSAVLVKLAQLAASDPDPEWREHWGGLLADLQAQWG
jgi:hypothetical protein